MSQIIMPKTKSATRILSILLIAIWCFQLLPTVAFANDGCLATIKYTGEYSADAGVKFVELDYNTWTSFSTDEQNSVSSDGDDGQILVALSSLADGYELLGWKIKVGTSTEFTEKTGADANFFAPGFDWNSNTTVHWVGTSSALSSFWETNVGDSTLCDDYIGGIFRYVVGNEQVVIEPIIGISGGDEYSSIAISSGLENGTALIDTSLGNSHTLTATPNAGYMFDYWECTSGAGTYGGGTTYASGTKIYNDSANSLTSLNVTASENSEFKAYFKDWAAIFPGATVAVQSIDPDSIANRGSSLANGYIFMQQAAIPATEEVRQDTPVLLHFPLGSPSAAGQNIIVNLRFYIDHTDSSSGATPFATTSNDRLTWPANAGGFTATAYIASLPYVAEGITIEAQLGTSGPISRAFFPLTVVQDTLKSDRVSAIAALDAKLAVYNANRTEYHRIRYLLLDTYNTGIAAIDAAETGDALNNAKTAALDKFNLYEGYKDSGDLGALDGVFKIAVSVSESPVFAYVPNNFSQPGQGAYALGALSAALENSYPGNWYIWNHGSLTNAFITDIAAGTGTGEIVDSASTTSGIIFLLHNWYATQGFSTQQTIDRDVLRIGGTIGTNAPDGANKDDLVWAIAALREIYADAVLTQNAAYNTALARVSGLYLSNGGTQEQTNDALAALFAAFPADEDAMTHEILPADVITVRNLIRAIGDVMPNSETVITNAETAYANQSDDKKALVPNHDDLVAARTAYDSFTAVVSDDAAALTAVMAYIKTKVPAPTVNSVGGEWAVLALARNSSIESSQKSLYRQSLDNKLQSGGIAGLLGAADIKKYTEVSRIVLALSSLGIDASKYLSSTDAQTYNFIAQLSDPTEVVKQGINGAAYALLALDAKPYDSAIRNQYVTQLLTAQLGDGGWALDGVNADVDTTAYVLQALAPYSSQTAVQTAITNGIAKLKTMQDATTGGFYNSGQYNAESAAQVIVALTALGIDPTGTEWTKNTNRNPVTALLQFKDTSGGFKHTLNGAVNQMATEQAAYALVAYSRFKTNGSNALYAMSDAFSGASADSGANKTLLRSAINAADALNPANYANWATVTSALTTAKSVEANADATQPAVDEAYSELQSAITGLQTTEKSVSTVALNAAIEAANELDEEDYNAGTWSALQSALSSASALGANPTQLDVDGAATAIVEAIGNLVFVVKINNTALLATIDEAQNLTGANYTADSWSALQTALTNATTSANVTTQGEVDSANYALLSAIGSLALKPEVDTVDKAALNAAIAVATALVETDYTAETRSELPGLLIAAKAVSADNTATQQVVDEAKNNLLTQINWLERVAPAVNLTLLNAALAQVAALTASDYTADSWAALQEIAGGAANYKNNVTNHIISGEQPAVDNNTAAVLAAITALVRVGADKALLNTAISQAQSLAASAYTTNSWSALQTALTTALAQKVADNAAQGDINNATSVLFAAIGNLVSAANKAELNETIASVSLLNSTAYDEESWTALQTALTAANGVKADGNALQSAVNTANSTLLNAILALVIAPPVNPGVDPVENPVPVTRHAKISVIDNGATGSQKSVYFAEAQFEISNSETAFSLLQKTGRTLVTTGNAAYDGVYVVSIDGFGEFSDGNKSGWMYSVNGVFPDHSASLQYLEDGDIVRWVYTRDLGNDIGGGYIGATPTTNKPATETPVDDETTSSEPSATPDAEPSAASGNTTTSVETVAVTVPAATITTAEDGSITAKVEVKPEAITTAIAEAVKAVEVAKAKGKTDTIAEVKIVVAAETPKEGEPVAHVTTAEVDLIIEEVRAIADAHDVVLTIESEVGTITLDSATLAGLAENHADGETVKIIATTQVDATNTTEAQKEAIGENTVIDLTVTVGNTVIHDFKGEVTVQSPYTPPVELVEEDYDLLTVYYVDDNGKLTEVPGAYFDPKTGNIVFTTTHFSKFMVAEWLSPFDDIAKTDWYYKSARFGVSNLGIVGSGNGKFDPRATSSRAVLFQILANMSGVDTSGGEKWYSKALEWGVSAGITDGTFPENLITREQVFQLLYRYSGASQVKTDLAKYSDNAEISSWALDGMNWAVATGLVTGRTATTLAPQATITRAEVVALLQKFIQSAV